MKYFPINQEIEDEIKIIKKEIYLSMNGISSENMEKNGILYKQNFGVSWIRIKEIAKLHKQNLHLAERLWFMDIRETKLLATLIAPAEEMRIEHTDEWIKEIKTVQEAEIAAMCLFSKLDYSIGFFMKNITQSNELILLTILHTAARNINKYSEKECSQILNNITLDILKNSFLSRPINALLENITTLKPSLHSNIRAKIDDLIGDTSPHCTYTYNNINDLLSI